jgi:RimJ/RimL family protein N-acetyltransferase
MVTYLRIGTLAVILRPADDRDWPMIHGWLRQPEIQRWWGSLAAAEAEVMAALRSDMGLCSIIEADGLAAGYAQAQDAQPLAGIPREVTAGTFRVDAFVGVTAVRGKGIAQTALRLVAEEVFATTLALGVIVVAPIRHEAAVRAYEKAGFAWVRVIDDPLLGPSWLMRLERPAA